MEDSKNQWIENILNSTKGSERAKPSVKVWATITQEVFNEEAHLIPIKHWRIAAVAAVLLIMLNVVSIHQYLQNTTGEFNMMTTENIPNQSIISDYQLYD